MVIKPIRLQRSRQYKLVSPNGLPIVYVGRPSKWANSFRVGIEAKNRAEAVKMFIKRYIYLEKALSAKWFDNRLVGKNLSCWCPLDEPCHADVLLKMANGEEWRK